MAIILYIIRHGQTVDNLENRIQGHTDSPLTELGLRQAEAVADRLASESFAAIYSSDLGRALRTAEIIAAKQPPLRQAQGAQIVVQTTPLLRESNLGVAQGLTVEQFAERWPEDCRLWRADSTMHRPPGAETLENVVERCGEFIQQALAERSDGEKLAVIAHSGSLRGLICAAFSLPVEFYRRLSVANGGLSVIDIGDRPELRVYNDTCHLRGVEVTVLDADVG